MVYYMWANKICYFFVDEEVLLFIYRGGAFTHMLLYKRFYYSHVYILPEQLLKSLCTGGAITQMLVYRRSNYSNVCVQADQLLE